ncbi:MAG TPA: hypothetical protein PKK11_03895 [Methanothrix sp.]|nr:hypothetical protein [Methanothrix sp.]HPT20243.1 hypothetical protein [Methanothrix sp.]
MPVTFEPHKRLETLEDYVRKIDSYLPLSEIKIQLLRCRLVGYSLAAEINEPAYTRDYIDGIFRAVYANLSKKFGQEVADPYLDPCASQYQLLDELRSYLSQDMGEHFMQFLRSKFKKALIPTLRLMTDLCPREDRYSWQEVKEQLQEIMQEMAVDVTMEECEERLERYLKKVEPILGKR